MKLFAKRALLLTVLVLCLFGISVLAVSAAEYVGTGATDSTNAVASFDFDNGDETITTYYYTDLSTAIAEAVSNGADTVTVLANAEEDTQIVLAAGTTLTLTGSGEPAPVITYTGTSAMFSLANQVNFTLSNVTINAASSGNGVIATAGAANKEAANATTVTLTDVTLSAASKALNFTATPYITVNATGAQLLSTTTPTIYAASSGSSVITLNFTDTLVAQGINITTLSATFKNVTLKSDSVASSANPSGGTATVCVARLNNNKVGGDGAYKDYLTGYYTNLKDAIAAAQSGDIIYVLKNTTLSATDITDKAISIVGSAKHTVTVASGGSYAIKLLGTEASLTLSNLTIDVAQTGKNTNAYVFGTKDSATGTYTLTLNSVDTTWLNGSGAIYGYGSTKATISLTDSTFAGGTAIINTTTDAKDVSMYLDNVTCVDSVVEVNTASIDRVTVTRASALLEYAADADAIADNVFFRVGATEGGNVYCATLADAIDEAQSGDTIYVLANVSVTTTATITGKTITLTALNDATITNTSANYFVSLGSNATLNLTNIKYKGNRFAKFDNTDGAATVVLKSGAAIEGGDPTEASDAHIFLRGTSTKAINITIEAGASVIRPASYSLPKEVVNSANIFQFKNGAGAVTLNVYGQLKNLTTIPADATTSGNAGANATLLYSNQSGGTTVNIYDGAEVEATSNSSQHSRNYQGIFYFAGNGKNTSTVNIYGGTVISHGANPFAYINSPSGFVNISGTANFSMPDATQGIVRFDTAVTTARKISFDLSQGATVSVQNNKLSVAGLTPALDFDSDATALELGMTVRVGDTEGGAVYYTNLHSALNAVSPSNATATNVYLLANTTMTNVGSDGGVGTYFDAKFRKKVHITSKGETPFTVTTSGTINFYLGSGAEVTFTNITFNIGNRLARIDGSCSIIFGKGCTMNSKDTIFIYENGNAKNNDYLEHKETDPDTGKEVTVVDNPSYVENLAYTIEVQDGAVINSTGNLATYGALIWTSASAYSGNVTLKISGDINISSNAGIFKDSGKKATTTLYYDVSTATVVCPATVWFIDAFRQVGAAGAIAVYAKGFANPAEAAKWGYDHSNTLTAMTYSAVSSKEWQYTFLTHGQFTHLQYNVLNSNGGEIWQLRNAGSIYQTAQLTDLGTVKMKSYNGATITFQGDAYRFRVNGGTTLILDGIELKAPGAILAVQSATVDKPAILKLVNGAKLTGTALSKRAGTETCAVLAVLSGPYTSLYVDETSAMTQTGSATAYGATLVWAYSTWANGEIIVKGKMTSTATSTHTDGVSLLKTTSTAATNFISLDITSVTDGEGALTLGGATMIRLNANAATNLCITAADTTLEDTIKSLVATVAGVEKQIAHCLYQADGIYYYYNTLARAIAAIPAGGEGTVTLLAPITLSTAVSFENKNVTINAAADIISEGQYHLTSGTNDAFKIVNVGTLTFNGLEISGAGVLVRYQCAASDMAQADRDIVINFVDTHVTANVSANAPLITSDAHHGDVTNKKCDSVTVNVDADSQIDFASSYTGTIYVIAFNHNSHWRAFFNLDGIFNVTVTGEVADDTMLFYVLRGNNPSVLQINVSETAKLTVDLPDSRVAYAKNYFTSCTGGKIADNKINLHLNAISENGALTLDGIFLYSGWTPAATFDVSITANDTSMDDVLAAWAGYNVNSGGTSYTETPLAARATVGGKYVYSLWSTIFGKVDNNGTICVIVDMDVKASSLLSGKTVTLTALEGVTVTNTSSAYFVRMGSNTVLNVENFHYQGNCFHSFTNPNGPATVNLNDNAIIEGGDPTANYMIITESDAKGAVTLNIGENAQLIRPASYTITASAQYIIFLRNGASCNVTVNVYGKFANLSTVSNEAPAEGVNAGLLNHSLLNATCTINIYETANVEGTTNNTQYNGQYQGVFYCAPNGTNTTNLNIYGGTIISHGINPFAYFDTVNSNVRIEGTPTISMPDLKYGMFWFNKATNTSLSLDLQEGASISLNDKPLYIYNLPATSSIAGNYFNDTTAAALRIPARVNGTYHLSFWVAVNAAATGETVYVIRDTDTATSYTLNNKTLHLVGLNGAVLSTSATRLFTLTNGAVLTITDLAITGTASTSSAATAGSILAFDDAEATAKSTATLTNVTLTANSSIPFYFGGVSVAELNIVGGTYSGRGMISFGYIASTDTYFDGVANVTITGTVEKHASLSTVSGGGDSASLIFVNSSKSVKDNVKVTLDYADLVANNHATYLRNKGTLTLNYSNGNLSSSAWVIGGQGSSVPYVTYTNVAITGTSADHIMRPYSGTAGAYIKFIGGSITANKVAGSNPILNFNSKMDVTFDGVTFNSTSAVGLFGSESTCPTITAKDCAFNLTGPILYQSNTALPVMLKGNTTVNSTAMGDENASTYGFSAKVLVGEEVYYVPLLNSFALSLIPTGGTGSIKLLAQHTLSAEISFQDKSVTLIGADAVVDDTNYDLIYTGTDNTFRIYDVGTLTLQNMNVKTGGTFFRWDSSKYSAKATADKNITLALVDTYVTVESTTASYFVGSVSSNDDNHLACNTFTLEMDDGSAVDFTSSASKNSDTTYGNHSFNFIYGNDNSHPYIAANIHGQVDISFTNEAATPFLFIRENNVSGINLNVTDTAKLKIALADPTAATTAYLAACWTGATSRNIITIALSAITENGALTLGDVSLYTATAGCEPQVCIIAGDTTLQAALLAWEELISYRVDYDGKYHYYTLLDNAKDAANANATVVVYLRTLPDVEAAVEAGAIFRLGDATDQGVMGQHYFTKIADLMEYAATQSMTDITVYVLTSGKTDSSAITLTGIKMTLTSYGNKQTLTLSGAPAFKLDADSHLVVDNVKIEVTNAFAQVVNADTAKYTKLDLEAGAYVDLKAATANGSKYFLMIANVTNTGILTVNVKQGAVINATANATGGTQGLFQISASRNNAKVAAGSSINVNGEINFSQNYTSTGYAPIFMVNNPNLVININDGATVTLGHTGTTGKSVWHAIFCFDNKATVNIGNATLCANADGALFGINGADSGAVLTVTGATFTAENFPMGVIDGWTKDTSSYNSQKVTFNNCTFTGNVASHSRMTGIVLNNATFNSLAHAQANFASLRVGSSDTTGYYSKFAGAIEATSDGGTLWVIADMSDSDVSIINKSLTIQGIDANDRPLITNSSDGSVNMFKCIGNTHLTLKDLKINAKARAVNFGRDSYVEVVDEVETTVYVDVTSSSLNLLNTDIYGYAVGANHNDMLGLGNGKGHHYFDLYIDATSSVGYLDGDPATIRSTRDYQVIFYYASVTGDIVIEGDVFAYVYFTGDQVNYAKVIANNPAGSWAANAPNSQHMIQIGSGGHTFMGDIIIKGNLTHKVVFPSVDENGNRVYPEDYPTLHSAYAIYVSGASAGVFVADGATITLDYENEYQPNAKAICFAGSAADYETTCDDGATAGRYHYYGVGALIAFLNNNAYKNNRLTVATPSGSSYGIVYDASTFISTTVEEDTGIAGSGGHDYYGANEIAALLSGLTGATVSATKDDTSSTYEIIVGIANRELVETYLPQLEMNEYAIIMKDNKILILAWHDAALNKGVAAFKYALQACADGTTVYLPALDGIYKGVANESWITNFTKPANGTLWGGQYVNDNSLQYVYNGYADAQAGHEALNAYCAVLESEGYTLVWQNVIENNLFRMYQNTESGIALYVAYNDYAYKTKYYGTNGEDGLYGAEESDYTEIPTTGDLNDEYFENRDHQKVLRVVSMPLTAVTLPDAGINAPDFSYDKVTNTLQTTLSFQSTSVGLGHVYMLEDGRFLVVDGGGAGCTSEGDVTEPEAIWQVMNKLYETAYGKTPEKNGDVIHIAAWYLTHAHWDHCTAFTNMLKAHGAEMQMDYMIGNFMASDSTYRNHATSFNPASWQQYVNGGFKYIKACTGQKLYLANLEIEVLMTYMDHAPFDIINSNDSNTVTRFSIHNQDAMNGVTAQVLYLGDSWRHSSRILCEMYDGYLQTEIVQLAHHGNIGCERVLYKAIAPRAVFFSHNADSFKSYVYFYSFSDANKAQEVAFRYAANVWCATNAEYTWSAPYGTYNTLEFLPARPNYEGIYELGIQPGKTAGTLITSEYDTNYKRATSTKYNYIHNASKGYKSVNVVWGDFSFTYEGSAGVWSPETLRYEGANDGEWVANGNNKIWVGNASTGNDQNVNVQLSFTAAEGYTNFTGTFKQNGEVVAQNTNVALASKEYKEFEFFLDTTSLPGESLDDQVIGSITVTLK